MAKYTVKSPIKYNDERHEIDAVVEIDAKAAKQLLELAAIEPFVEAKSSNTGPTDPAERLEAIKSAIASFDPSDTSLWTKGGFPNLDALEARLAWRPTASERDKAFTEMQPNASSEA